MSINGNNHTILQDSFGRIIEDLRISVTERCNFRCVYCLPEGDHIHGTKTSVLSYEEIERLTRVLVGLGIRKVRVTGGEPLLRRDLEVLVAKLAAIDGVDDLAITTNGFFLAEKIAALAAAGLRRVNLSIDSLDPGKFALLTGSDVLDKVLNSLTAVENAGLTPVKINAVIIRGYNDDEIVALAEFSRRTGHIVRFIEFMPLDNGKVWKRNMVVPASEIFKAIDARWRLVPIASNHSSETAQRYAFEDGGGEIGIIAPVTQPFCGSCNRIRLTADGQVRTCLFSLTEHDTVTLLRNGKSDEDLAEFFHTVIAQKEDGHHINDPDFVQPARTMSHIGG